jgi:type II restriction enzyme
MKRDKENIVETIKTCLRDKFSSYKPETDNMPFHYRLLGKDRMALYSFIQSLNTKFGASIYEPVAVELAKPYFKEVRKQYTLDTTITTSAQSEIQNIMNTLSVNGEVNKKEEIERIRKVATEGTLSRLGSVKVDLFLISESEEVYMFDLKTVKPNKTDFVAFKRTLLEWLAVYFYQNPLSIVHTSIAIPYNPYEPGKYKRWTMKGMLDIKEEVFVADEFWDFLGGVGAYKDLLDCFEIAGIQLRPEIDTFFERFRK